MNNSVFSVILNSIKARVTPVLTRFRMWMRPDYIRTRLIAAIRNFFVRLFDMRPRNKKDYYPVFSWLVSKRLAFAIVIVAGVLSIFYLIGVRASFGFASDGENIKTYRYNSFSLRMAKGLVRIKGKSGYLAYEGNVSKGYTKGQGRLFAPDGTMLYQGNFEKSKFEKAGTLFYRDGTMHYQGNFHENIFEGKGTLYRENGSKEYDGDFLGGKKEGEGNLYDNASSAVYSGNFSNDELVYSDLLGMKATDVAKAYTGQRDVYQTNSEQVVAMSDINAIYLGQMEPDTIDGEVSVQEVVVMKSTFTGPKAVCRTIDEVKKVLGNITYEGESQATFAEAVAINKMLETRDILHGEVAMTVEKSHEDLTQVSGYDSAYDIYIYTFQKEGLVYTFVSGDRSGQFIYYSITKGEEEA